VTSAEARDAPYFRRYRLDQALSNDGAEPGQKHNWHVVSMIPALIDGRLPAGE
jgi:hypothetical protein